MRVLLLGATGNLGLRLLPALLAHDHAVIAYVREPSKLRSLITPRLASSITIITGDAFDTNGVEAALRDHDCDAVMNTAGNVAAPWKGQYMDRLVASVSGAAVRLGREKGTALRAWFIGGLTSLVYPYEGNVEGWKVQDFLPRWMPEHHRQTERTLTAVSTADLEWTLLCVAWMLPVSRPPIDVLESARGKELLLEVGKLPDWRGTWLGELPWVGRTVDLFWCSSDYTTKLEDVANVIASDLAREKGQFVGEMVGMKDRAKMKSA